MGPQEPLTLTTLNGDETEATGGERKSDEKLQIPRATGKGGHPKRIVVKIRRKLDSGEKGKYIKSKVSFLEPLGKVKRDGVVNSKKIHSSFKFGSKKRNRGQWDGAK